MQIKIHEQTFGVTQRSLKVLRDELADRIDHRIFVWELPSEEEGHVDGYGFCIIDAAADEAVIIGDGFTGNNGGEGGAGRRAAQALLSIYGIRSLRWDPVAFGQGTDWGAVASGIGAAFHESGQASRVRMPQYIDHVLTKR